MTGATRSLTLDSGALVYVWPNGQARAVVLLQHGFAEHAHRYLTDHHRLIPHLLAQGFEVWAMDLIGHGHSPGPRRITDVRHAVADHVRIRQRLRERNVPVVLFGHSLGGLVTAGSVAAAPSGVAGLVLLAPVLVSPVPSPVRAAALLLGRALPRVPLPGRAAPLEELTGYPEVVERARRDPLMLEGRVPFLLAATALEVSAGVWRTATRWRSPCLLVHGTADTATDPALTRRLAGLLDAADTTLHLVDGGRHELLNDLARDQVLDLLTTWLDRHVDRGRQ